MTDSFVGSGRVYCTHGDDGVTEADVREEEREPAREGTEAAVGAAEAERVDV